MRPMVVGRALKNLSYTFLHKEGDMLLVEVPQSILVYDMGSDYYDRLTVVYPDGAVFTTTMSESDYFKYAGKYSQISTDGATLITSVPSYVLERIKRNM